MQYFYINGRYVKNRTMMAALETAFKGTVMHGKFPGCILQMQMPTDLIDVNVHPAKTEVRFAKEKDVFDAVYHAVKSALLLEGSKNHMFSLSDAKQVNDINTSQNNTSVSDKNTVNENNLTGENAFKTVKSDEFAPKSTGQLQMTAEEYKSFMAGAKPEGNATVISPNEPIIPVSFNSPLFEEETQNDTKVVSFEAVKMQDSALDILPDLNESDVKTNQFEQPLAKQPLIKQELVEQPFTEQSLAEVKQTSLLSENEQEPLRFIGEVFKTYIVAQLGDEICFIDKHAAHERVIYEELSANYGNVNSQMLMQAVVVNLSGSEKHAVLEQIEMLENVGLEIDDFGGTSVLVRAVPCDVEVHDVENLVIELANKLSKGAKDAISTRTDDVLHSVSCRAAMKAGDKTSAEQLLHLAQRIISGEIPPFCPHGRPCILRLTRKEIEKQFGRIL